MADIIAIKAANDAAVTNKVGVDSLSPADEGGRLNAITDELRPYKVYTAIITQENQDDPVATVLENTIGNIIWTRTDVGIYVGTLTGSFTDGKTWISPRVLYFGDLEVYFTANPNTIDMTTFDTDVYADDVISNDPVHVEIRVYP